MGTIFRPKKEVLNNKNSYVVYLITFKKLFGEKYLRLKSSKSYNIVTVGQKGLWEANISLKVYLKNYINIYNFF